jgi:hypothetical protein
LTSCLVRLRHSANTNPFDRTDVAGALAWQLVSVIACRVLLQHEQWTNDLQVHGPRASELPHGQELGHRDAVGGR